MFYKFKTKPFAHQLKALEMSWDKEVYAYFMEMGTGKSKVLIDNVSMLYDKGEINGLLLIAPKGVYKNWYDSEIPVHMADHIEKKTVLWTASHTKPKLKELNTLFETGTDLHIFGKFFLNDSTVAFLGLVLEPGILSFISSIL